MPKKKDLTGQRFGRWTVLYEAEPRWTSGGNRKVMWHCRCDCGNEKNVHSVDLLTSKSNSCGCYNSDVARERMQHLNHKTNKYDLSGDFGRGWDSKGNEFWFDLDDYDLIKDYCWRKHRKYFEAKILGQNKTIGLHKLVMNDLDNLCDIDHVNTNAHHDNRKCNLRRCNRSENNRNKVLQKNNTSGVCGVKKTSKRYKDGSVAWEAWINYDGKSHWLGQYRDFNEAVRVRKEAEKKYYGDYSYDASQKLSAANY